MQQMCISGTWIFTTNHENSIKQVEVASKEAITIDMIDETFYPLVFLKGDSE